MQTTAFVISGMGSFVSSRAIFKLFSRKKAGKSVYYYTLFPVLIIQGRGIYDGFKTIRDDGEPNEIAYAILPRISDALINMENNIIKCNIYKTKTK